jgi:hypothetical protein
VISIYTLVFAGSTPLGNLYAGFFADRFGPRAGFLACGIMILVLYIGLWVFRFGLRSKEKSV